MSVTAYERLRIAHRALLQSPPTPVALEQLLETLPASLQDIARMRPALMDEVDTCQQHLHQVRQQLRRPESVDVDTIIEDLHHSLSPLFAG
ncbi:hypothetical protein E5K00_08705 [Hymenobacter aquaticus]|uniref:Uncharacterized protein n=1 Tax=Hymenobacter aquaticus TaxID=1867101 RepID=A0A4Z0Q7V8_9BACT|nr:hypothetical protein [Hymenobacter aquaticus]TGE25253.1 hypothetical protein E5K00_08705 [Hymenobacter aquaticus]